VIERTEQGGIAVLTLAHGPVNALDVELCEAIADGLRDLRDGPARAVVLTGSGRAFSAGVDLRRVLAGEEGYAGRLVSALTDLFRTAFTLPKPLVAAVNGHAIAGGCVLAACADRVLMSAGRIGVPEVKVGVPFPRTAVEVVRYAVGEVGTRRLVLDAETMSAEEGVAVGLVDRVVPGDDLPAAARAAAAELADVIPADTFAHTKAQLRREAVARMDAYVDEDAAATELWIRRAGDGWTARYLESVTGR
jgi:enoyl-CoA hydratase